jgi:CRP/FNR family transcriptional regulator, cyclic AMP receptor protein
MHIQQRAALLGETKLFGQLAGEPLRKLAERTDHRVFEKRQTIFVQDEFGDRLFIVVEGVVKLLVRSRWGDSIELVRHGRAAVLGEIAVLDSGRRSATAEAVERTVLLSLARNELFDVLSLEPRVAQAMLRGLAEMVRRTTDDLAALAFLDLEGRVARRILDLARTPPPTSVEGASGKRRRITQTEIAQMVRGTRQTVNRALRSLERKGLVELTASSIGIKDLEELRRRAEEPASDRLRPMPAAPGVINMTRHLSGE